MEIFLALHVYNSNLHTARYVDRTQPFPLTELKGPSPVDTDLHLRLQLRVLPEVVEGDKMFISPEGLLVLPKGERSLPKVLVCVKFPTTWLATTCTFPVGPKAASPTETMFLPAPLSNTPRGGLQSPPQCATDI